MKTQKFTELKAVLSSLNLKEFFITEGDSETFDVEDNFYNYDLETGCNFKIDATADIDILTEGDTSIHNGTHEYTKLQSCIIEITNLQAVFQGEEQNLTEEQASEVKALLTRKILIS